MAEIDPKKAAATPPPATPGVRDSGRSPAPAGPEDPDPASPAFDILDRCPPSAAAPGAPSGNLVEEIVDQITEKQARSTRRAGPAPAGGEICSFCLEEVPVAGTPYRLILKCAGDDAEET